MTLTTHALVGAATAQLFAGNLPAAFGAAFVSHFLIDAIPHWDYKVYSIEHGETSLDRDMKFGKFFLYDISRIGFDFALGVVGAVLLFPYFGMGGVTLALVGALAGVLPDALQFAYWKVRREPLTSLYRFHVDFMHSQNRELFRYRPVAGIISQLGLVVAIVSSVVLFLEAVG